MHNAGESELIHSLGDVPGVRYGVNTERRSLRQRPAVPKERMSRWDKDHQIKSSGLSISALLLHFCPRAFAKEVKSKDNIRRDATDKGGGLARALDRW